MLVLHPFLQLLSVQKSEKMVEVKILLMSSGSKNPSKEHKREHAWGITAGISYTSSASVNVGVAEASTSLTVSAEVNYNGKKGGNQGKTTSFKVHDTTTVTIPAGKYATVKFKVTIINDAKIPFVATIKRTSEAGIQIITQKGTWNGVMVVDSFIEVQERPLSNPLKVQ
eukprot:TCONS_00046602-protein